MKKRKTRFDEGGDVVAPGDGVKYFDEDELAQASRRNLREEIAAMQQEGPSSEAMADSSMRRNLETGEYYSTENLGVAKKAAPKAPQIKAAVGSGRGGRGGPTAAELAEYQSRSKSSGRAEIPTDTSIKAPASTGESTSGMSNLDKLMAGIPAGMGATRFLQATARGLANTLRTKEAMKKAAQAGAKQIGEGRKMLESPGRMKGRELATERAERAARRDKEVARGIRQKSDDSGAIRLAKGGTASSRADGCAMRGKTRGKIY